MAWKGRVQMDAPTSQGSQGDGSTLSQTSQGDYSQYGWNELNPSSGTSVPSKLCLVDVVKHVVDTLYKVRDEPPPSQRQYVSEVQELYGFKLHAWQQNAINEAYKTNRMIVVSPTGSGKSVVFLMLTTTPCAIKRGYGAGPCVLVAPMISLVNDQARSLAERIVTLCKNLAKMILRVRNCTYVGSEVHAQMGI